MLALAFRDRMTADQTFQSPNSYRQIFFEEVIQLATKVSFTSALLFVRITCL
jgi:hypothetical protein